MKLFTMATAAIVLGLAFAGCGMVKGGKTMVKYEGMPIETKAPMSGTYLLYAYTDYNPRVRAQVQQGETLGFRRTQTGQLFAVAGENEYPLNADETYYWKQLE